MVQSEQTVTRRLSEGDLGPLQALVGMLELAGPAGDAVLHGADPLVRSPHRIAEASAYGLLLRSRAAAAIWQHRTGQESDAALHLVDALHALHSTHFLRQSGFNLTVGAEHVPTNGLFRCSDGRFIMIESGPPYTKLERGYLDVFDCGNNRASLAREIARHPSGELEERLSALGLPACIARTRAEWLTHPQGAALAVVPVIEIEKLADGAPKPLPPSPAFPLSGVRVLDFTHVLAGPGSTRWLAGYGADVLHVSSPYHRDVISQNLLVNMGKRSCYLLLTEEEQRRRMLDLIGQADIFANSYRSSVVQRFGLDPRTLAASHDGLVYLSVSAYGAAGPWSERPGFDQNGQVATGFSAAEGGDGPPRFSPVFYLNDELTGFFAAAGMMAALLRRAHEGGSYHVRVSLARTAMWVQDLAPLDAAVWQAAPETDVYEADLETVDTAYGPITELAHPVSFSALPLPRLNLLRPFGADPAAWW